MLSTVIIRCFGDPRTHTPSLYWLCLQLAPGLDLAGIAAGCHGYSGADLAAVAREAALHALARMAACSLAPTHRELNPNAGTYPWPELTNPASLGGLDDASSSGHSNLGSARREEGRGGSGHWAEGQPHGGGIALNGRQGRSESSEGVGDGGDGVRGGGGGDGGGVVEGPGQCAVGPGDFLVAMRRVGPSIVRGLEVDVPHTRWAGSSPLPAHHHCMLHKV